MKFNLTSALMGACFVFGLFGLNSFMSPRSSCLTEEQANVLNLLSVEQLDGGCDKNTATTLRVTGANLQIVNGIGYTSSTNGVGNLIIGYGYGCSGSHNVVIGDGHTYSSYGGLISGSSNIASGVNDVVFGNGNEDAKLHNRRIN